MSLQDELAELENDIKSLRNEIVPLQEKHDQLFKEVSLMEAEFKHRKLIKPAVPKNKTHDEKNSHSMDFDEAPALIQHSHFDVSIEKYFRNNLNEPLADENSAHNDEILRKIKLKTAAGQLALRESIFRFGGITAFAINDCLYDTSDDALLGLRFDVLSHTSHRYLKPHYIILRRKHLTTKGSTTKTPWLVFRYTTPPYVPLDQFGDYLLDEDESVGLQHFAEKVRALLICVQYKHDKTDALAALSYGTVFGTESQDPVITRIEKDLACQRVVLHFKTQADLRKGPIQIEIECSEVSILSAICRFGDDKHETFVQSMLQGSEFQNLLSVFKEVFKYLKAVSLL